MDRHTGGKWSIHGTKQHKDNQLLSLINDTDVKQRQCLLNEYVGDIFCQLMIYTVSMCTSSVKYI